MPTILEYKEVTELTMEKANNIPACIISEVGPGGETKLRLRNSFVPLESIEAYMKENPNMDGTLNELMKKKLSYIPAADLDAAILFLHSPKGKEIIEEERQRMRDKIKYDIQACPANRKVGPIL